MKIRIPVGRDSDGRWSAVAWGGLRFTPTEQDLVRQVLDPFDEDARIVCWIEAEIPDPVPVPVVQGEVKEP